MKTLIAALLAVACLARADVVSTSTTNLTVVFTNGQANASWTPTAVLIAFPSATTTTVTITRTGEGSTVTLSSTSATNVQSLVWAPAADYIFPKHSALTVSATVSNFSAQLHRKAAP
jgi:hypothetical protein